MANSCRPVSRHGRYNATGPSSMTYNPDVSTYGNVDYTPSDEMYTVNQPEMSSERPERPKTSRGRRRAEAPPRPESRRARSRRSRQDFDPDAESYGRPASRVGFSPEAAYRYSHDEYSRQVSYDNDSRPGGEMAIPQNSPTNSPTDMFLPDEEIYSRTPPQEEIFTHTPNRDQLIISPSQSPTQRDRHKKKHHSSRDYMNVSPIQRDEEQINAEDLHHVQQKPVQYQSDRLYHHQAENFSNSPHYRDSPQYNTSPQYTSHSPQHSMPRSPQYTQHGTHHRDSPQYSGYSTQYAQQSQQFRDSPYRDSPYRDSPSHRESPYRSPHSGSPEAYHRPPHSQRPKSARPKTGRKKSARYRQQHHYEQETSQPVQYDAATILSSGDPYGRPSSSLSRYKPLPAIGASTPRTPLTQETSHKREPVEEPVDKLGTKTEQLVLEDQYGPAGNYVTDTVEDMHGASGGDPAPYTLQGLPSVDTLTSVTQQMSEDIFQKSLLNYEKGLPDDLEEKTESKSSDREEEGIVAMDRVKSLEVKHDLPNEPGKDEERVLLAVKLPNGQRIQRCFRPDDSLHSVLHFAENSSLIDYSEYDLVCNVPKIVFDDLSQRIQDAQLQDRTVLYLEEKE